MRILWVASTLEADWSGGIGRVMAGTLPALAARGHSVHLAGRERRGQAAPIPGVALHPWPDRRAKWTQLAPLRSLVRELDPDVVHFHSAVPHGALVVPFLALRRGARPSVWLTPYTGARSDYTKRLSRRALARADGVIAGSRWSAERAIRAGAPRERMHVVPAGVALPERRPDAKHGPTVVALSRLVESKGVDVLIDAFDAAVRERPEWGLMLAGEGRDAAELRRRAAALPSGERIAFLGDVRGAAKTALLEEASIGVQPSREDNYPGSLLELQAHGVACVGTNVGGIPEILGEGRAGALVPGGDARALARVLAGLMDDPEARARLAEAGRDAAAERSWERAAEQLERVYAGPRGRQSV